MWRIDNERAKLQALTSKWTIQCSASLLNNPFISYKILSVVRFVDSDLNLAVAAANEDDDEEHVSSSFTSNPSSSLVAAAVEQLVWPKRHL